MITPSFKPSPNAVRYVFLVCDTCRGLRLDFAGKAAKARKRWHELVTSGRDAYFETVARDEGCRCLRLVTSVVEL